MTAQLDKMVNIKILIIKVIKLRKDLYKHNLYKE